MRNAIKTTKKKLFEKDHVETLKKNGNLIKNSFVRPFAQESTKKFIHPGDFFLTLQVNKNHKKSSLANFQYQFIKCRDCGKVLEICQIQRKKIDNCREFVLFTYYCRKCDLTYYIFKFINKKEEKGNEY